MIKSVAIIGFGAIGVLYATEFRKVTDDIQIIANQERISRYQEQGVLVNGQPGSFCFVTPEEARPVDLLLFTTKFMGLPEALQYAKNAVSDDTIVLSCLNGTISEGMVEEALHPKHLLYCTVQGMDTTRTGTNVVYQNTGSFTIGEKDGSISKSVQAVESFLKAAGFGVLVSTDIMTQLWSKWMLNVGVNQACAVYNVPYEGIQRPGRERTAMIDAMNEARAVAAAEGIMLSEETRDRWIALMDSLAPDGEPSMKQDTREGRPTEVGLFADVVCSLGAKHGIATPQNDYFRDYLHARKEQQ
ncbi:MAG: ketopantoate reductase family protein [Lachnospiraceae bacterium]|nr:ketopantoate reductase family protein [Lachnospiraceae bacterium]